MNPTSTIELIGSYAARHLESGLEVDYGSRRSRGTTKSTIGPSAGNSLKQITTRKAVSTSSAKRSTAKDISLLSIATGA